MPRTVDKKGQNKWSHSLSRPGMEGTHLNADFIFTVLIQLTQPETYCTQTQRTVELSLTLQRKRVESPAGFSSSSWSALLAFQRASTQPNTTVMIFHHQSSNPSSYNAQVIFLVHYFNHVPPLASPSPPKPQDLSSPSWFSCPSQLH